jgi:hypothetical protein
MEMSHPDLNPAPVHTGIYGIRFTSILAMAQGALLGLLVLVVYHYRAELPIYWQPPEPKSHHHLWEGLLPNAYLALALLAGGLCMLLRIRPAATWLIINGLICFVVLSAITLINLLIIATNVRDLDVQLILPTALTAALAGLGFLIARNAWAYLKSS